MDWPNVNGVEVSYCSIRLIIGGGVPIKGVTAINYKDVGDIPLVMGASATPLGWTRGENHSEGDIELLAAEWDELLPKLTIAGSFGYMEQAYPVSVTYAEASNPTKTRMDYLPRVRFFGAERSHAKGTDALTVKLQMKILPQIKWHDLHVAQRELVI
jgi:hypothetical protein